MAKAITQMEGTYPPGSTVGGVYYPNGTPAYQNNNPGNLMYAGQTGASPGGAAGFAKFDTLADGQAALNNQIQYNINKGMTLQQFFAGVPNANGQLVGGYAPGGTSNAAGAVQTNAATQNYINFVAQQTGLDPNVPLTQYQSGAVTPGDTSQVASNTPSDNSGGDSTDSIATQDASVMDTLTNALANTDPVILGAIGIGAFGILYVMFGR